MTAAVVPLLASRDLEKIPAIGFVHGISHFSP